MSINIQLSQKQIIRRLGNLTASSVSEVLLCARGYSEQSSQAQRSIVSTSNNDSNPSGSGAKIVRIDYLNSDYDSKYEDIALNGTSAVNTVATDIRFIENFRVISGAAADGAIKLMTNTGGGGSEFCGIGVGTQEAFLCHHYVPQGKRAFLYWWGVTGSDEVRCKLRGQERVNGVNLVDTIIDLEDMLGIAANTRISFDREIHGIILDEKTYIRITVVPNQATSTTIRGWINLWEEP